MGILLKRHNPRLVAQFRTNTAIFYFLFFIFFATSAINFYYTAKETDRKFLPSAGENTAISSSTTLKSPYLFFICLKYSSVHVYFKPIFIHSIHSSCERSELIRLLKNTVVHSVW
jgi:hypothetical protein